MYHFCGPGLSSNPYLFEMNVFNPINDNKYNNDDFCSLFIIILMRSKFLLFVCFSSYLLFSDFVSRRDGSPSYKYFNW